MQRLTVMLPTLDEARALPKVLNQIPYHEISAAGYDLRILVVDGRSTDGTQQIALDAGCDLLIQKGPRGKGIAMREAFAEFLINGDDVLIMLDADGTYDPKDITRLLDKLTDNIDVVIGSRIRGSIEEGAMSRLNYVGNHLLTWSAVVLHGTYISDICTGYWAFKRRTIEKILPKLNSIHFEIEAEMYAACCRTNLRFSEIPISYKCRIGDAKLGSISDGARIIRKIIARRLVPEPIRPKVGRQK